VQPTNFFFIEAATKKDPENKRTGILYEINTLLRFQAPTPAIFS
jgi:hypothetical protein